MNYTELKFKMLWLTWLLLNTLLSGKHKINPENPILSIIDEFCLELYTFYQKENHFFIRKLLHAIFRMMKNLKC